MAAGAQVNFRDDDHHLDEDHDLFPQSAADHVSSIAFRPPDRSRCGLRFRDQDLQARSLCKDHRWEHTVAATIVQSSSPIWPTTFALTHIRSATIATESPTKVPQMARISPPLFSSGGIAAGSSMVSNNSHGESRGLETSWRGEGGPVRKAKPNKRQSWGEGVPS